IVVRLSADQPGEIHFTSRFQLPENRSHKSTAENGRITVAGKLTDNGLQFEAQLQVSTEGGQVSATADGAVTVSGANEAVLLLSAGTDYALAYPKYRSDDPHQRVTTRIDNATDKTYEKLLADHQLDYRTLFDRVTLDIGQEI